ncbi:sensor histidine kinase [Thermodesulforhabdus norvegica]|uniref:histidine kinase n=1 Tax=Thermodesulforhabdus norvegica TaxID=39841 RepID=A0A1I4SI14_9BACT|nr:PAS domain-containing sensor histidine kinase [Thermodesulforhabdus norvegica]SFM63991.1 two-component system, NtrC family, sensor kinase [Thermodesulforhabdus norvegica]
MGRNEELYYRSLRRTIALTIVAVSLIPLFLMAAVAGYRFHTSYKHRVIGHIQEIVEKHARQIDQFLREKLAEIQTLATLMPLEKLTDSAGLAEILNNLQRNFGGVYVDLGCVDSTGYQIAYAGPFHLVRANYADARWFKEASKQPYFISDVFLGLRGLPHFIVAVQVAYGDSFLILRATIDFLGFTRLVESVRVGETGRAFIVNRLGEYQTAVSFQPLMEPWKILETLFGEDVAGSSGLNRVRTDAVAPYREINGTLYVAKPLKNGNWFMIYEQDSRDAFSELYAARRFSIALVALSIVTVVLVAWALSYRVAERIEQADREKEILSEQVIQTGKLASLGELAAGVAHEINNPVAIMVEEAGWIEDLLPEIEAVAKSAGREDLVAEIANTVRQIKTQGARCKDITQKLLSFARGSDARVQEVNVNDVVEDVVGVVSQKARYDRVNLKVECADAIKPVLASPSELQQVLLNLINNALDAMDTRGGELTLRTSQENGWVVITVADTGPGIPESILPRIFDPFFTTKPVGKGTGLGLSICYGIVKRLGGEITVDSVVGQGTTFGVYLPVIREEEESRGGRSE